MQKNNNKDPYQTFFDKLTDENGQVTPDSLKTYDDAIQAHNKITKKKVEDSLNRLYKNYNNSAQAQYEQPANQDWLQGQRDIAFVEGWNSCLEYVRTMIHEVTPEELRIKWYELLEKLNQKDRVLK